MFKSITVFNITEKFKVFGDKTFNTSLRSYYRVDIVDDDFTIQFISNSEYDVEDLYNVYSKRQLNIAKNIFIYFLSELKREGITIPQQIYNACEDFPPIEQLKSEFNKLILFI